MKFPKSEPYQRSRHRATLQTWVVAATAVAAIGLPQVSSAAERGQSHHQVQDGRDNASQDAKHVAAMWIDALLAADSDDAISLMRLPADPANQSKVQNDLDIMTDLLAQEGVVVEPVAHRQRGHWALSAWAMNVPDVSMVSVLEPVTLYNPSADGLFDSSSDWQVVPQGVAQDSALKPLYNADCVELEQWFETLL